MSKIYPKPANFEKKNQVAPNSIIFDPNLSDRALRLILALNGIFTSGGSWIPRQSDIQKRLGWGEEKMRNAMDECKKLGFLRIKQNRVTEKKEKGQFAHNDFEFCIEASFKEKSINITQEKPSHNEYEPSGYFPGTANPGAGNQGLVVTLEEVVSVEEDVCVDSPPVGASPPQKDHVKILKKTFDGSSIEVSKSDLYTASIQKRKDWTSEEISEAWEILEKYSDPVRDWFKFCEGTIENLRKMKNLKKLKESKCPITTNLIKPSINECGNSKVETSENDTWGLHLVDWKSQLGQHKKSQSTSKNPKTS